MAIDNMHQPKAAGSDPRRQALFEVTAEVLGGLTKAFPDYEENNEPAWK